MPLNRTVNESVGWGVDAIENKVLFCNDCRAVFYKTQDGAKIVQAKRIFSKKHKCRLEE
ncbi:hypothetical protein [Dryocola sp. BD626]|uniref:hypothetical protein n=1 Tax=Dryocola sp. BD626 TaxID=3133273 RepID=UPI003F4F885F